MKLNDFRYALDKVRIPSHPVEPRDSSRLMVVHRSTGVIEHRLFRDLVEYMNPGDCVVLNDTKVFPARLIGKKERTEADIEVFLLRELQPENKLWDVLVEPARKIRIGNKLYFDNDLVAEVVDNTTSRGRTVRFLFDGSNLDLYKTLDKIGETPLPPYLKRPPEEADKERYQTVFARERGAVAAPTAGMHFTNDLLGALKSKGVHLAPVTLHIGWGTFRPVEVEDLTKHRMDSENYYITPESADVINGALHRKKNKVVVCGTSSVRAVETSITASGHLKPSFGWTDKFIFPPYEFKITEALITNFHQPESTLLMLVAAFCDYELLMRAYQEAIEREYGFFSFGDALLIL
jgi:S-adenosylmethionine:tRNA ribosyltransferase-isomerase